jgi:metal transporter CNNM
MALTWIALLACLAQSAMFSGLNLALFSLSKLELEVEAKKQNRRAITVLEFRQDSNFTLVTILWGNVAVNVLLALLAESLLFGVSAFFFSTFAITIFAEITPQAYFSRHALRVAASCAPVLRFYQWLLFPVAKPTALVLDRWLGHEALQLFTERDLRRVIALHMESEDSDIAHIEGQGALNFLAIDDLPLTEEGEPVDPESVIKLEFADQRPLFPAITPTTDDPFLRRLHQSGKKWAILTDGDGKPRLVMHTYTYLADVMFAGQAKINPLQYCHKPIVVTNASQRLGTHLPLLRVNIGTTGTDVIDNDVILLWCDQARIITGSDILGRLFRGASHTSQR